MVRTKRKDHPINPIDIQPHSKKLRQEKKTSLQKRKRKQNNKADEDKQD